MLTRGPKDSPDPCKAQGQPCTLRGTKGRVTGAQAQPWAWLCCESRPCRGGGGGVGAALASESPGSPRRDLPDPTTHKRGDEGLGQKVPTAELCPRSSSLTRGVASVGSPGQRRCPPAL